MPDSGPLASCWRRNPPDDQGYWLRQTETLQKDQSVRETVTLHYATRMRDGRVLINLGRHGQPNYTYVTSPTVTCRTAHWWWFGPVPFAPPGDES